MGRDVKKEQKEIKEYGELEIVKTNRKRQARWGNK